MESNVNKGGKKGFSITRIRCSRGGKGARIEDEERSIIESRGGEREREKERDRVSEEPEAERRNR